MGSVASSQSHDWFERLTGFKESSYEETRSRLEIDGTKLRSRVNGCSYGIGELELAPLKSLRDRQTADTKLQGKLKVNAISGDVRHLHQFPAYAGALFQVASQFNLLEMISPNVTPEHGVTGYQTDRTQGPACAIAAGAGTIYRNYFAPVDGSFGQTGTRQLNGLADIGTALSQALGLSVDALWTMRNGYALCSPEGLSAIGNYLKSLDESEKNVLRGLLRVGLHRDVEVTDADALPRPIVSQAYCSALPVRYTNIPAILWQPFAQLVLEAAYEATILAALLNAERRISNVVLLTSLGGGAFGNNEDWIYAAMNRALKLAEGSNLDVKIVCYRTVSSETQKLVQAFA